MAEVYQLKVNGKEITLGKGPDADDEFASLKELQSWPSFNGFAFIEAQIGNQTCFISFPISNQLTPSNWESKIRQFVQTKNIPWPVFGCSMYEGRTIVGLLDHNVMLSDGHSLPFKYSKITFIKLNNLQ